MEAVYDGCSDKRRILNELAKCLKTVFVEVSGSKDSSVHLDISCPLINGIDRSLQYGLLNLLQSYWPLVRSYSHAQTLQTIDTFIGPQSSPRMKGHAWLLVTLTEGSLLSYLQCIMTEPQTIARHYAPHAILRDPACMSQLSSLLTGLESINFKADKSFSFSHESSLYSGWEEKAVVNLKEVLELPLSCSHGPQGTVMTSSMTSSLASPGDSGFTQLDSETDTASFTEVVLDADSTSVREDIAVLPVDPCTEKTIRSSSFSDVVNANKSSGTSDGVVEVFHDSDDLVYQREKNIARKSSNDKQQKRVSFHECTDDVPSHDMSMSASTSIQETGRLSNSLRESASHLSRAVGDFSSFDSEQEGVEIGGDSSLLGNDAIEELLAENVSNIDLSSRHDLKPATWGQESRTVGMRRPVAERGMPEGQEDPPHRWSLSVSVTTINQPTVDECEKSQVSNNSSPAPSCSSLRPQVSTPRKLPNGSNSSLSGYSNTGVASILNQTPSKACLVNRFLRSITEKKISNRRSAAVLAVLSKRKSSMRRLSLYINGVKPSDQLSQELLNELREEINYFVLSSQHSLTGTHNLMVDVNSSFGNFLHNHLKLCDGETIHKILKVRDTAYENRERLPLLAVLSDHALYVLKSNICQHSILPHSDLSTVLVGPNSQWISLINKKKECAVNLVVSEQDLVAELVGCIELLLRQRGRKTLQLPAVVHLLYEEFFRISQWSQVLQGEKVYYYSVVHTLEELSNFTISSSETILKSYFMFRILENNSFSTWKPGFFTLRAGVLQISSDEEELVPVLSVDLKGVTCQPTPLSSRPHTIQVGNLQIAAPDDYVAQDWLLALQRPLPEAIDTCAPEWQYNLCSSSLILTESRIILMRSLGMPYIDLDSLEKPYLTAFLSDVISVHTGAQNSSWCFMEFSCREVHDSGGDYVIFFNSSQEMIAFRESLWMLHPQLVKETQVISQFEPVYRRCNLIAANLCSDWDFVDAVNQ